MSDKKDGFALRKCTTPKARASYANVFNPSEFEDGDEPKYNITLLFDKDDDLKELKRAVKNAAVEAWGEDKNKWPKKRRLPFRDGDEEKPENEEYKGKIFVYASSKKKPQVIDQQKKIITEESGDFYSGCYCRATLVANHYKVKGNEGITFTLLNLQKWADGEPLGGKRNAADDFDDSLADEIGDIEDGESEDDFDFGDED